MFDMTLCSGIRQAPEQGLHRCGWKSITQAIQKDIGIISGALPIGRQCAMNCLAISPKLGSGLGNKREQNKPLKITGDLKRRTADALWQNTGAIRVVHWSLYARIQRMASRNTGEHLQRYAWPIPFGRESRSTVTALDIQQKRTKPFCNK